MGGVRPSDALAFIMRTRLGSPLPGMPQALSTKRGSGNLGQRMGFLLTPERCPPSPPRGLKRRVRSVERSQFAKVRSCEPRPDRHSPSGPFGASHLPKAAAPNLEGPKRAPATSAALTMLAKAAAAGERSTTRVARPTVGHL